MLIQTVLALKYCYVSMMAQTRQERYNVRGVLVMMGITSNHRDSTMPSSRCRVEDMGADIAK